MTSYLLVGLLAVFVSGTHSQSYRSAAHVSRLYSDALRSHDSLVPPTNNGPINVTIGLSPIKLVDVDAEKGVVTMTAWDTLRWNDPRISWDPAKYGGADKIHVDINKIWSPDLVPYNLAAPMEQLTPPLAIIFQNGEITYVPGYRMSFHCNLDNLESEQGTNCTLKVGSWTYSGNVLNLKVNTDVDMSNFVSDGKVEVVSASAVRNLNYYPCCPEPYIDATFTFVLRTRRTSGTSIFNWQF